MNLRAFILFILLMPSLALSQAVSIFESNGVTVEYDKKQDTYEVRKNGEFDSRRIIQTYADIPKMKDLLESLGAKVDEEIILTFNNNLMKSLRAPTQKEVMEVGLKNLDESLAFSAGATLRGESCPVISDVNSKSFSGSKKNKNQKGWFCAAPTEDELSEDWNSREKAEQVREERTFMRRWLGDNRKERVRLDTYNDNFLHGGGIMLFGEQKADDRSRTYGHALEYDIEGDEGSFSIRYENNLFTRLSPQEGKYGVLNYWTDDGKLYLDAMEETTLTLEGTKKLDNKGTYAIGSLSMRERTDENRGSQSIQDGWHEMSGSVMYDYQEFMEDGYSLEAKVGVGKKFEGELGEWRCRAIVEGLAGVDLWTQDRAEIGFNASVGLDSGTWGGRGEDNPWLAIDAYTRQTYDTEDNYESMYGAKLSTSFKWGEASIKPYMGIEYYDTEADRMFQTTYEGNELIHTVGVEVNF